MSKNTPKEEREMYCPNCGEEVVGRNGVENYCTACQTRFFTILLPPFAFMESWKVSTDTEYMREMKGEW